MTSQVEKQCAQITSSTTHYTHRDYITHYSTTAGADAQSVFRQKEPPAAVIYPSRLRIQLRTGFFGLSVFSDSGVKTEFIQCWRRGWVVWARGDLNFVGADLRTVHNMNVKQGVVLQELIAKELTVADALEAVCAQCDGGELTTREKRMLRDIKACGRALTTIAAEQGEQVSATIEPIRL
jgi:hypothetical protein